MSEEQIENKENKEEKNEILSEKNENLDEKNEISLNLNPMEIWDYNYCSNLDFSEKNLSTLKLKNKTKEDIEYFYSEIIHSAIHPSLKKLLWHL